MISATPAAATPRPPLRAREPQDPGLRAGLAAVRWKRGNPYCDRTTLRVAQRFACGLDQPAVRAVVKPSPLLHPIGMFLVKALDQPVHVIDQALQHYSAGTAAIRH